MFLYKNTANPDQPEATLQVKAQRKTGGIAPAETRNIYLLYGLLEP